MAEDKPFEPTASRLERAKREGNIARSSELNTIASFGAGAIATFAVLPEIGALGRLWIERIKNDPNTFPHDIAGMMALVVLMPAGASAVAGSLCALVQGGGLSFNAPTIKLERLNPKDNVKRMFGGEGAIAAARAVLAFIVATALFVPTANLVFNRASVGGSLAALGSLATLGAQRGIASALGVALLFGTADYLLVHRRWFKKLKMSFYELKKEMQETEGNPQLRGRRRQRHRSLATGSVADVRNASFVVANPTHVAVALEYCPPQVSVPRVLLMAAEGVALRVRARAGELGIPVVEDVELARTLYATARIGRSIPRETFLAVAEIVTALAKPRRSA
ncbi:MAG: EscU/YscU/HrcU family type III secretion system export apparatus switch protein [Vulcanimicrobiaceae bacterium]